MQQQETFDTVILGSGQGGKLLAWHLARSGKKVAAVERRWVGGSCPAVACMPSKNEVWSARVAHLVQHAGAFGTTAGPVRTDMEGVRQRKQKMVEREIAFHLQAYSTSGAELIMGNGRLVGPKTIEVRLNSGGTRILTAGQLFLNLGTRAAIPNVPGIESARALTHIEALELDYVPAHLLVFGGGYVAIELAQAYRRFGSRVTIIQAERQLLGREDPEIAAEILRILTAEGVQVLLAPTTRACAAGRGTRFLWRCGPARVSKESKAATCSSPSGGSRTPPILGSSKLGLHWMRVATFTSTSDWRHLHPEYGRWANVPAAHSLRTSLSMTSGSCGTTWPAANRSTRNRLVQRVLFTDPPLAHVGLSEGEAQRLGIAVRVARLPMSNVLRTETTEETQGFMKVLVGSDARILGFTMIGPEAGEVMAAVQTAMLADLPYPKLRDAVIAHLTMAEGLGALLSNVAQPAETGGVASPRRSKPRPK